MTAEGYGHEERGEGHVDVVVDNDRETHRAREFQNAIDTVRRTVEAFNSHPDRFLFGTDNVAPADQATQLRVYHLWDPVWAPLTPEANLKIRKGNYERIFDAARIRVRAWEKANVKPL